MGSEEELKYSSTVPKVENKADILYRPKASPGLWLCCLLPTAYLAGALKHQLALTDEYKFSLIIVFGLMFQSFEIYVKLNNCWRTIAGVDLIARLLPAVCSAAFISICLHQGVIFSILLAFFSTFAYTGLCYYVLKHLPQSFTYGEATIVLQGCILFLVNALLKFANIVNYVPITNMERMSTILQVGLVGVSFIAGCCHFFKAVRGLLFYFLLGSVALVVILFPIGNDLAVVALIEFVFLDTQKICMVFIYLGLLGLTVAATIWHVSGNRTSNTRVRKIFHILIVLAFIPGLLYQCTFLFVASGISLALLIVLEVARVIKLSPANEILDEAVKAFIDEKDAGLVALTPIYLLVGCSLPLWIHPCPCDLTDGASFELLPLLSGLLSVGIGDTAASVIGSKFGRIKYPGSIKTVEGTLAAVLSQAIALPILIYFGFLQPSTALVAKFIAAIVTNSIVETFTDQVDNLVLPLVTYTILCL